MASDATKDTLKKTLVGVRKGGTRFPRYSLPDAISWAKKLVSRTHLGAQPKDVVLSGVVGSRGPTGEIKISSLKQFGLLEGSSKAYSASALAKSINSAPEDELQPLLQRSALSAVVFSKLFETFAPDEVSRSKLKQRLADLGVHPDETDKCIQIYIESLELAGLVSSSGDKILHNAINNQPKKQVLDDALQALGGSQGDADEGQKDEAVKNEEELREASDQPAGKARAVFNVNISLDSSLDTDKLERQLKLLKKFGAI